MFLKRTGCEWSWDREGILGGVRGVLGVLAPDGRAELLFVVLDEHAVVDHRK